MISYSATADRLDFEQILALQRQNLPGVLEDDERLQEGFVTLEYTVDLLDAVRGDYGHIVGKENGVVVAYALVLQREHRAVFPILEEMFEAGEAYCLAHGRAPRYFVMGQICVAKHCRGQGVFRALYEAMRTHMQAHFDFVLTDVSRKNPRSMRAHEAIGFQQINGDDSVWQVIAWNWVPSKTSTPASRSC